MKLIELLKKGDIIYLELDTIRCISVVESVDATNFTTRKAIANMGLGWKEFHVLFPGQTDWKEKRKYIVRKANEEEILTLLSFYDL